MTCITAYLTFNIFRIGNIFVQQVCGTPIGGFLSSALLAVVLGACENKFGSGGWKRYLPNCAHLASRAKVFAASRYEDDILSISLILCKHCLGKAIRDTYSGEVDFQEVNSCMSENEGKSFGQVS